MRLYLLALAVSLLLVVFVLALLRVRRLREKYAAVWIVLALAVAVVGIFPQIAFWLAQRLGVQTPANLVFAVAVVVLLLVCVQLSVEVSSLEGETRTLAEEIAIQRHGQERLASRIAQLEAGGSPGGQDPA